MDSNTTARRRHSEDCILESARREECVSRRHSNKDPGLSCTIGSIEKAIISQHDIFARAFILSDPAKIARMLHQDVVLIDDDENQTHKNSDSVLSFLVSPEMTRISRRIRKAANAVCVAPNTTMVTYSFGFATLHEPFTERIEWHVRDERTVLIHRIVRCCAAEKSKATLFTMLKPRTLTQRLMPKSTFTYIIDNVALSGQTKRMRPRMIVTADEKVLWKTNLTLGVKLRQELHIPSDAHVLSFQVQDRRLLSRTDVGSFSLPIEHSKVGETEIVKNLTDEFELRFTIRSEFSDLRCSTPKDQSHEILVVAPSPLAPLTLIKTKRRKSWRAWSSHFIFALLGMVFCAFYFSTRNRNLLIAGV